jgi:hypothetical protein
MTASHEPNKAGFAGAATTPEVEPAEPDRTEPEELSEDVAVPADDLTGAITDAFTDRRSGDDQSGGREPS